MAKKITKLEKDAIVDAKKIVDEVKKDIGGGFIMDDYVMERYKSDNLLIIIDYWKPGNFMSG